MTSSATATRSCPQCTLGRQSHADWVDLGWVDELAPLRRLVLIDSRGHGRSEAAASQADYGYAAMGEDVLRVMDELEISRADLFGYSMVPS